MFVYVGCYTVSGAKGRGEGITVYSMDGQSGDWTPVQLLSGVVNPSFLTLNHAGDSLYCVHGGDNHREVSAFAVDQQTGTLASLNTQPCGGRNPVHLSVHPTDRFLAVANYTDGSVAALPITPDGTLAPLTMVTTQTGALGPNAAEQSGAHPHHIPFDPAGRFLIVPDKGLDCIFVYRPDLAHGALVPNDPPFVRTQPGSGPRHAAFHPHLPYVYVVNELDSTITTYAYNTDHGVLSPRQTTTTLPPTYTNTGDNSGAEIAVAPSGRFVYASNRGHDSIAIFAVDQSTGTLAPVGWEPTQGSTPRFFALDPSGAFLYAANQGSDTIVTFRVDRETGMLTPTGQVLTTGSPVCIVFAEDSRRDEQAPQAT